MKNINNKAEQKYTKSGKLSVSNDKIREELIKYNETGIASKELIGILNIIIERYINWRFKYSLEEDREDCIQEAFMYIFEHIKNIPTEKYRPDGTENKPFSWITQLVATAFVCGWRKLYPKNMPMVSLDVSDLFEVD